MRQQARCKIIYATPRASVCCETLLWLLFWEIDRGVFYSDLLRDLESCTHLRKWVDLKKDELTMVVR